MNGKGFSGLAIIGVGLVVVIGVIVLALGSMGFVPGVSDLMGTNQPRDLGVSYSQIDYASGLAKVPGASVNNPEFLCLACSYTSTGSVQVNTSFTQEEFTAMMNARNNEVGPLKEVQVKFNSDGTMEATGMIDTKGIDGVPEINGPIYAKGKINKTSSREVTVDLESAEFGRIGVPSDQLPEAEKAVNDAIKQAFTNNPGLSVESIQIVDGAINFQGTLPKDVTGNPNTQLIGLN